MKKRLFKKALTSTAAIFTIAALAVPGVSVFAENTPTAYTQTPNKLATAAAIADVTVNKDIVLFNVDGSQILSPNVTYSYEITSAAVTTARITTYAPEDLNTDGSPKDNTDPITVTVKRGIIEAVSVGNSTASSGTVAGTISFGAANDTNNNNNTRTHDANREDAQNVTLANKVSSSMTITVDANKIFNPNYNAQAQSNPQVNGPGVYRYKIEDVTTDATLQASGITEGPAADTIYLDVYTKYNDAKTGLEVYGYVLLRSTTDGDNAILNYDVQTQSETIKITGFDTQSENTVTSGAGTVTPDNLKSDSYKTYNVEVKKETAGDLADAQHNFPFKVELSNDTITSQDDFYYQITKDNNPQNAQNVSLNNAGAWSLDGITNNNTLALHNGDKIVITGLPSSTSIKVTEKNDTYDTYTVSATYANTDNATTTQDLLLLTGADTTGSTSVSVASNATAAMKTESAISKVDSKTTIVFTNTLKDISVTGLMFSIAPFVFITIAGVALLVLVMKNRKNSDNKSKI